MVPFNERNQSGHGNTALWIAKVCHEMSKENHRNNRTDYIDDLMKYTGLDSPGGCLTNTEGRTPELDNVLSDRGECLTPTPTPNSTRRWSNPNDNPQPLILGPQPSTLDP